MSEEKYNVVNHSVSKVDGPSLVNGRSVFTDDFTPPRMLVADILTSPKPHARIVDIDVSEAKKMPGVKCILHKDNVPRIAHTTAGQGWPEPSPYDQFIFPDKVRFVGDRVAAVAGETEQAVRDALGRIKVEYEELNPVLDPEQALHSETKIHDEKDFEGIYDPVRNIAAHVDIAVGDVDRGFEQSDVVVEETCETHYVQHSPIEPHVSIAYLDQNDRLVVRTSTQVPFHIRRILSRLLDIPIRRIRVVKPRIGGGFGVKQELVLEDLASFFALRTGRPVRLKYSREQEFRSSRTRHPVKVKIKLGAEKTGMLNAVKMEVLSNTGAYGPHSLTVLSNVGSKTLPLYNKVNHIQFVGNAVYTNLPVAGAFRGYGAPQGYFSLEVGIDKLACELNMDPLELRTLNHINQGETSPVFEKLGEGKEGTVQYINSCGLDRCIELGAEKIGWNCGGRVEGGQGNGSDYAYGTGMAINMQGSGIPLVDMAGATIKLNEDGSFNLYVGATDLGTGSDTILAQIAAEVLGVGVDQMIVHSSDTDFTPFDSGAYASSTTYVSGSAVEEAAQKVKREILDLGGEIMSQSPQNLTISDGVVEGQECRMALSRIALNATSGELGSSQRQVSGSASVVPQESPPPFAAHFVALRVDKRTGQIELTKYVAAVDCGTAINPNLARGQMEGAIVNGIGYALTEEMEFSSLGHLLNPRFLDYKIPNVKDIPPIEVLLVESEEPSGPMGAKSVGEIGINGPVPAIANAVYDACGIRLTKTPFTPQRVFNKLSNADV